MVRLLVCPVVLNTEWSAGANLEGGPPRQCMGVSAGVARLTNCGEALDLSEISTPPPWAGSNI